MKKATWIIVLVLAAGAPCACNDEGTGLYVSETGTDPGDGGQDGDNGRFPLLPLAWKLGLRLNDVRVLDDSLVQSETPLLAVGHPLRLAYEVQSGLPVDNVFVEVDIVRVEDEEETVRPGRAGFEADYPLAGLSIDRMGLDRGGDVVTYDDGLRSRYELYFPPASLGLTARAEHEFTIPHGLEEGLYAVVLSVHDLDRVSDPAQGYFGLANWTVCPQRVYIEEPVHPNLIIHRAVLEENSFELPAFRPDDLDDSHSGMPDFQLQLQVESMAVEAAQVGLAFELEIPGYGAFPLSFTHPDVNGALVKTHLKRHETLAVNQPLSATYDLYINEDAHAVLETATEDLVCHLNVHLDPYHEQPQHRDNVDDNHVRIAVAFLCEDASPAAEMLAPVTGDPPYTKAYPSLWPPEDPWTKEWGDPNTAAAGLSMDYQITYEEPLHLEYTFDHTYDVFGHDVHIDKKLLDTDIEIPYAWYLASTGKATISLLNNAIDVVELDVNVNADAQDWDDSYFQFDTSILGIKVWGDTLHVPIESWSTKDEGNGATHAADLSDEKYILNKTWTTPTPKTWTLAWFFDIDLTADVQGDLGWKGSLDMSGDKLAFDLSHNFTTHGDVLDPLTWGAELDISLNMKASWDVQATWTPYADLTAAFEGSMWDFVIKATGDLDPLVTTTVTQDGTSHDTAFEGTFSFNLDDTMEGTLTFDAEDVKDLIEGKHPLLFSWNHECDQCGLSLTAGFPVYASDLQGNLCFDWFEQDWLDYCALTLNGWDFSVVWDDPFEVSCPIRSITDLGPVSISPPKVTLSNVEKAGG